MEFQIFLPTKVFFGKGDLSKIKEIKNFLGKRALIVTGQKSTKVSGSLSNLINYLKEVDVNFVLFDKVIPNPDTKIVIEGGEKYIENDCTSIIAIGGGSSIDAAKAIGIYAVNREIAPFLTGEKVLKNKIPTLVAIPTTSGTGSEVTKFAVITYENKKLAITSELIIPDFAILDPLLTLTMNEKIVRDTGLDALSHALEGLFSIGSTPFSDIFGYESIKIIYKYLPRSFSSSEDLEAREMMHLASMYAGIQISHSGTGIVHAMGYPLTLRYEFPHGYSNALLMPYVFKFELPNVYEKMAKVIEVLDLSTGDKYKDAEKLIELLVNFNKMMNVPLSLKDLGVEENELEIFADEVDKNERLKKISPRAPNYDEILSIYKNAYLGVL